LRILERSSEKSAIPARGVIEKNITLIGGTGLVNSAKRDGRYKSPSEGVRGLLRRYYLMMSRKLDGTFGPLPSPEKWVFIVGCYNSGTTLLHRLLAQHPLIGSMKAEGQFYTDQLPIPQELDLPRLWALRPDIFELNENSEQRIDVRKIKKQWGAHFDDYRKPILIEKSPTNAARTRWLQKHFENAHFIGIVRNGYAVAEGIRRKTGQDVGLAAKQWAVSNEIMVRDFAYLNRKMLVSYEKMTENPGCILTEISQFIGISYQEQSYEAVTYKIHEQESSIYNMNQQSIQKLTNKDIEVINGNCGNTLRKFGYSI